MQKVLVSDEDFQEEARRLGLSPEGITAENFSDRLIEAERLEYAKELGLPETTTWRELRDVRRARLKARKEPLRISPQCRSAFQGEWLHPAQLTRDEIHVILDRLPKFPRRYIYELLVVKENEMTAFRMSNAGSILEALKKPVNGKFYRLARGVDRTGKRHKQLWEVKPQS